MMTNRNYSEQLVIAAGQNTRERDYWLDKLQGFTAKSMFFYDFKKTGTYKGEEENDYRLESVEFKISGEDFVKLSRLVSGCDYALNVVLVTILTVLLNKYTGSRDITVGTSIYKQDIEGEFVNTALALRNQVDRSMTFKTLLLQVRQTIMEAVENQCCPIEIVIRDLNLSFSGSDFPLFDIAVLLENIHYKEYIRYTCPNMVFSFKREDSTVRGMLEYNVYRYRESTAKGIAGYFTYLAGQLLSHLDSKLSGIDWLPGEMKKQLLFDFNDTGAGWPRDKTIDELFESRVRQFPDRVAVVYHREQVTYGELNQRSNRLARLLRERGVTRDSIAAVIMEPSVEMVVGILGILKAGGAYLPIDVQYPASRVLSMLQDCRVSVILLKNSRLKNLMFPSLAGVNRIRQRPVVTDPRRQMNDNKLPGEEVLREIPGIAFVPGKTARTGSTKKNRSDIVIMDAVDFASPAGPPAGNLPKTGQSTDLAYIIFTSGSTGKPKGMMIEHRNLVRLMVNDKYPFDFNENDTWTLFHSYCFDFSVWEIFGPLVYGGTLVVISRVMTRDPRQFLKILVTQRVTVLNQTPSAFYHLMNTETDSPVTGLALRYIIFGGEALAPIKLKPWWGKYPQIKFINMYGITETTVHVTFKEIGIREVEQNISNTGNPIPTLTTYVMDNHLNLLPVGVPGELFVGGEGVGRGYLNQPELTRERFLRNPYKDEILYRSGDLMRLLPDGDMIYCGRMDHQVKIRGFRVEPGEIESMLLKHESVKEAVVLSMERKSKPVQLKDENKYLCAYVVPSRESSEDEPGLDISALRVYLARELPGYMIPSYIVPVETIPLTGHGKVDWKALPDPEVGIIMNTHQSSTPRTETEERMVELWSEILGIKKEKIGIDANFFELGGHSLRATILETSMHKVFEIKVPMAEIFKTPTIKELAVYVERAAAERYVSINPAAESEFYPLSSPQRRLFFLHQFQAENESYNVPFLCILEGKIDPGRMEKTFGKLIDRHESLRTSFLLIDTEPVQKVHRPREIEFAIEYYDAVNPDDIIQNFFRSFDLSTVPLLRVGLIKEEDQKHILMVDMHHIITDAFSISIFIKEFTVLYAGQDLPPLHLQYKDYVLWENSGEQQGRIRAQETYWLEQFAGDIPTLLLPTDYPRSIRQNSRGSEIRFTLGREECQKLKTAAVKENATLYMVLLALYNVLLSKLSGQESIIVGTAAAGRRHKDLESIIGYFLNTLPLWNFPAGEKTFLSFFREVKQTVLKAFENQDYPLDDLVEKVVKNRAANRMPLFDVILGVDKPEESPVKIPGLSLKPYPDYERKVSTYDLILLAYDMGETLSFRVKYKTTLFKEETVKRFITYFKNIVSSVLADPLVKLKTIEMISEDEKEELYSMIEKDESEILIDLNM